MKLNELIMRKGLQKTILQANTNLKIEILKYIGVWIENCHKLIKISLDIFDITNGKRQGNFWSTIKNQEMTYGEVFTKMLDLEENLSMIYNSDWVFKNIMIITEEGNWTLQNELTKEFTGARHLEFSSETSKMDQFLRGQRNLKWMIIHVTRFIETGKLILKS
jgi:predicted RNA-binding protein